MEANGESGGVVNHEARAENFDPNVANPGLKVSGSPSIRKSAIKAQRIASKSPRMASPSAQKSASKFQAVVASPPAQKSASRSLSLNLTPAASPSPHKRIRQRKFVVAKRSSKREIAAVPVGCSKCNKGNGEQKCFCVAYENLRSSQDEFLKNRQAIVDKEGELEERKTRDGTEIGSKEGEEKNKKLGSDNCFPINGTEKQGSDDGLLKEARVKVAEPSSGRVLHLVKAFEKLLSPAKSNYAEEKDERTVVGDGEDGMKSASPAKVPFSPPEFLLTCESLGLDSRCSSSLNSSQGSISRRASSASDRRSRRKSVESDGTLVRRKRRQLTRTTTSREPFKLRTEQRGKCKEEKLSMKVKEMMEEEEKRRIPVAQGLPWTTDEPERLVKPPVKERTRAIDLVLHSDVRAVERAEFDHQVAEKLNFIEQYKAERERQQKLAEEEEIRRLRKELVPKAQPMPYFDKPFIPQRPEKNKRVK
nr:protein tpx2 [Ipomoea batatas]